MYNLILDKNTHTYYLGNKKLISVSKIINSYLGSNYCNCNNCKFCINIKNAAYRGNVVHKCAELYFKNINKDNLIEKIKEKIKSFTDNNIDNYCNTLFEYLKNNFNDNLEYISEKSFNYDIVAGTPDLIFKSQFDLYSIIDFKTYKVMNKELKEKSILQIVAYYWLLKNNGYELSNIHFIVWVQKEEVKTVKVEITKELLHMWEIILKSYKENWYGNI